MGENETPMYYSDLSQDELRFLQAYNQLMFRYSGEPEQLTYYREKIDYISSLIKE